VSVDRQGADRGRAPWITLGLAVLLLLLSRLPFLLGHADWGVFNPEHLWMITDPAAVARSQELSGSGAATLPGLDEGLYALHYHAGARWVSEAVGWMGWLTGAYGLLQLKLVGLLAAVVALVAYTIGLVRIWPGEPVRWALPIFVAWIAPPTLLLWLTLMPMGHYMETWLFHALYLPLFALVLADRASPQVFGGAGALAGVMTAYVASNLLFPVVLAFVFLLVSTRSTRQRLLSLGALAAGFALTWIPTGASRLWSVLGRAEEASLQQPSLGGAADRLLINLGRLPGREVIVEGDGFARRGIFALLEPAGGAPGTTAAWVMVGVAGLGAVYLLWHTALLLHPRRRAALDLPGRVLGTHGLILVLVVLAYLAFFPDWYPMGYVSYLTLAYPALMLGVGAGAAALVLRWRVIGGLPVLGLLILLGVAWAQSSAWVLRDGDRPPIQRADFRRVARLASFDAGVGRSPDAAAARAFCLRAHPGDDAFCGVIAWQSVLANTEQRLDGDRAVPLVDACSAAPPEHSEACALAAGARLHDERVCDPRLAHRGFASICDGFEPALRQACVTGLYQGPVTADLVASCTEARMVELCIGEGPATSTWQERACLEGVARLMTGVPPLPAVSAASSGACSGWPRDLRGLCVSLGGARQAAPDEVSCEQVYLERFAHELPDRHELVHQQCAYLDLLVPGVDLFPSCAIGVARALDGLSCSWRGTGLRL